MKVQLDANALHNTVTALTMANGQVTESLVNQVKDLQARNDALINQAQELVKRNAAFEAKEQKYLTDIEFLKLQLKPYTERLGGPSHLFADTIQAVAEALTPPKYKCEIAKSNLLEGGYLITIRLMND